MDEALKNLFPVKLQQAAIELFGMQSLSAILLEQLPMEEGPGGIPHNTQGYSLLHPTEKTTAHTYKLAKRRSEYVTGRICAKLALLDCWGTQGLHPDLSMVEIANASSGRPYVQTAVQGNGPIPEISITHGGKLAAALAAASTPCGIDLQEQKETLIRVKEKYCTTQEFQSLSSSLQEMEPLTQLALLWSAKEAAKKALSYWSMPGFLDLNLVLPPRRLPDCYAFSLTVTPLPGYPLPDEIMVLATIYDQYSLAVCILPKDHQYA